MIYSLKLSYIASNSFFTAGMVLQTLTSCEH